MLASGRLSAAIEILTVVEEQRRPAGDVLKDWGRSHRFAGSKDRSAIADLVFDALRVRASAAWLMASDTPRAQVLGALKRMRKMEVSAIAELCSGLQHAPAPLSEDERQRLEAGSLTDAPAHVIGDFPEWLAPAFDAAFGSQAADEGAGLAQRAPIDLRANLLKADRTKVERALAHLHPSATPFSPWGLRIASEPDARSPAVTAEPAYIKGQVEIQDEGSQLATLLTGAAPGSQVLDLCAGGGGKTLALAAMLVNKGQIYATDRDNRRLAPIFDRLARANARNVQVRAPRGEQDVLGDLEHRCDLVLVDAPCTGTGTWRRNPDAKWRLRPGALEQRVQTQDEVMRQAARFVKPGGRLVYITCSVLREENEDRVDAFLAERPEFAPVSGAMLAERAGVPTLADRVSHLGAGLRLTPRTTGTDGFYVAALSRIEGE